MKKAFIICGPETSGNRLTRLCFLKAGIQEVGFDMGPALDVFENEEHLALMKQNDVVFARRSIPHGWKDRKYIDVLNIPLYHIGLVNQGFKPYWIIPIRNFYALTRAKEKRRRPNDPLEPAKAVTEQYTFIFAGLIDTWAEFYFFNVSALMLNVRRELYGLRKWTGIDFPADEIEKEIYDADEKHYPGRNKK